MRNRRRFMAICAGAWAAGLLAAPALGPHELLLLVNPNSADSLAIANHYAAMRGIPPENVVYVTPPPRAEAADATITMEEFTRDLWTPAWEAAVTRGLAPHLRACVFSAGFPVRISTRPEISVQGAMTVHRHLPDASTVATGRMETRFFRGPQSAEGAFSPTVTLENFSGTNGQASLWPSMALAWTGARGLTREESLAVLRRGADADGRRSGGPVFLIKNNDVRSRCRDWQFDAAARELESRGVRVVSGERFPAGADGVAGLMTGAAEPDPRQIASFAPGAFAEHLTSLAAEFHRPIQTKITEWLLAGATCSAGTVTEPMSVWSKFPSARIFAHLAAGASMLEALAESVACPLQLFSVGDPLSRPWGGTLPVRLEGPPSVTGRTVFRASAEGAEIWMFLLDGRRVALSASPEFFLDPVVTAPGWHVLRAVAYGPGLVRNQGYAEIGFECSPSGRRAVLDAGPGERVYSTLKTASVRVRAEGATRVAVYALGRKLAEAPGADAILSIRPDEAGEGPVVLQPVALFPEGGAIRGRPVPVVFAPPRSPPALRLQRSGSRSHPLWILSSAAPEAGAISWVVRAPAWDSGWRGTRLSPDTTFSGGTAAVDRAGLRLNPSVSNLFSVCAWPAGTETGWAAEAMLEPEGRGFPRKGFAYLAWDVCDDGSFQFFGMNGESGAWVRGEGRPGRLTIRESRGAPLRRGQRYALAVRTGGSDEAAECYAGETRIFSVPRPRDRKAGRWGVVSGSADAVFARVEREWPLGRSSPDGAAITVRPPDGLSPGRPVRVGATDGAQTAWQEVSL